MLITIDRKHLSEKQILFLDAKQDEVLFGGARGGGKSYVNRIGCVEDALKYPGRKIAFVRNTIKSAKDQFNEASMYEIIPKKIVDPDTQLEVPIWRFDKHEGFYEFANGPDPDDPFAGGSRILLVGVQTLKDAQESYQGIEFFSIYWDELTKADWEAIEYLKGSLRDKEYTPKFRAASNPGERSHRQVKNHFVDPWTKIKKSNPDKYDEKFSKKIAWSKDTWDEEQQLNVKTTYAYIPATLDDNPNKKVRENYLKILANMTNKVFRDMYRYGSWEIYEGKFWDDIDQTTRFLEPKDLGALEIDLNKELSEGRIFMSMDWGYTDSTCILWHLETSKGVIITFNMLYTKKTVIEDIAREVMEWNETHGYKPKYIYMPWDMFKSSGTNHINKKGIVVGDTLVSVWQDTYPQVIPMQAESNRKLGWMNMSTALKKDIEWQILEGGKTTIKKYPRWIILKNQCRELVVQIQSAQSDLLSPDDIKKGGEDHAIDAARMFWVAFTLNVKIKEQSELPPEGTGARVRMDIIKQIQEAKKKPKRTSLF